MPEKATVENECSTCALLRKLKDDGEYYASQRPDKKYQSVTICKSVVVMEDYYNVDGQMEFGGRVSYNPRPLNFCSECGRKIDEEELTW